MESPTYFNTITQYDHSLNKIWNSKSCKKGLACPFFALFSAQQFLNNNNKLNKSAYLDALNKAIYANKILNIYDELSFTNLLSYTDLNLDDINITISTLIESGEYDLKKVFTKAANNCAFIFLKNAKFFTIFKDKSYHIRDCHESIQYSFSTVDSLIEHLNKIYQFNKRIIIDNIPYDEYSTIEFIKITNMFQIPFNYNQDDNEEDENKNKDVIIDINDSVDDFKESVIQNNRTFSNFDILKLEI